MAKSVKNKEKRGGDVRGEMGSRVQKLYVLFVLLAISIVIRLVWVSFVSNEVAINARKVNDRIFFSDSIYARRGAIVGRNGDPLAISILRYRVEFDMASEGFDSEDLFLDQVDTLSKCLADYFKDRTAAQYTKLFVEGRESHFKVIDTKRDTFVYAEAGFLKTLWDRLWGNKVRMRVYDTIRNHRPLVVLPREIDYNEWQKLKTFPILNQNLGITYRLKPVDSRSYPYGALARRTLGRIGDQGKYGIEHAYREQLKGTHRRVVRQRIARGYSRLVHRGGPTDAVDGKTIHTTLDPELQHIADQALREQLTKMNASWGVTMVMEVSTGDILAMVNLDETRRGSGEYAELRNNAIGRRMEPGSTFKLAAMLALLDDCKMDVSQSYDTKHGASTQVGGPKGPIITDDHDAGGVIDLKTAFAESSNIYFTTAIYEHYKNKPAAYEHFLRGLHLDRKMGLELLGEVQPSIPDYDDKNVWHAQTLPNLGYGYVVELAPIHTLTLYNAIANGGKMVAPRLVTAIEHKGKIVERFPVRTLKEQVCTAKTLKFVRECMIEAARHGTGEKIFGDTTLYDVAIKTGTAQVAQGDVLYEHKHYLGSMATFFPTDKPRYTLLTVVYSEKARNSLYHGSNTAGPVNRDIVNYLMYRDGGWQSDLPKKQAIKSLPLGYKGGRVSQINDVATSVGATLLNPQKQKWGRVVMRDGRAVVESMGSAGTMPDVSGLGLKDALYYLEMCGLEVSFSGAGAVVEQSIAVGDSIVVGDKVHIVLK